MTTKKKVETPEVRQTTDLRIKERELEAARAMLLGKQTELLDTIKDLKSMIYILIAIIAAGVVAYVTHWFGWW